MDDFPAAYIAHNLPCIVLSGLQDRPQSSSGGGGSSQKQSNGVKIVSELPNVGDAKATQLREAFLEADGSSFAWNANGNRRRPDLTGFKVLYTGREYVFPQRKAAPPPLSPSTDGPTSPSRNSLPTMELHSPLSPLSPSSPLFPDGVLTPDWLVKHQQHVPSVFVSFFEMHSDPSRNILEDNQLKNEINWIKSNLSKSGFKTRLAVVLVSDETTTAAPELEERVSSVRRATGLDPKTSLFFLPPADSKAEITSFVTTVLTALQPISIEYYRDLTKHARRKKGRGYIPPPTAAPTRGTSQSLSAQGWNARYEFKLGVFAEFRQEMDAAERHYSFAIEEMFHHEGVLENTPVWSPRWDEARTLSDITAIRVLRCQLWRGMTTGAAESWLNYKERMGDIVDRRGKGTATYGWSAWEARWAEIMAQLITNADLPVFQLPAEQSDEDRMQRPANAVYAPPEKAFSAMERLPPFNFLHHPGYWYRTSGLHARVRRQRARALPDEDRSPPDQIPAAQAAQRVRTHETYMVPPPNEEAPLGGRNGCDHTKKMQDLSHRAEKAFADRRQGRAVEQVRLELAQDLMRENQLDEAIAALSTTWDSMDWREDGWWDLAAEALQVLHECASRKADLSLLLELEWEMSNSLLHQNSLQAPDVMKRVKTVGERSSATEMTLQSRDRLSPLSLFLSFANGQGHVGDSVPCQLLIRSQAAAKTEPIVLSGLDVNFGGSLRRVHIDHNNTGEPGKSSQVLEVREQSDASHPSTRMLTAEADLTFSPGQARVFNFAMPLRDADLFAATSARLIISSGTLTFGYVFSVADDLATDKWWFDFGKGLEPHLMPRERPHTINVLPKPPKVQIQLGKLKEQYFTSERIEVDIEIVNEETEVVHGLLNVHPVDQDGPDLNLAWLDSEVATNEVPGSSGPLEAFDIGSLPPAMSKTLRLLLTAPIDPLESALNLEITYRVESDMDTPISKGLVLRLPFVSPFEANYELTPRLDASPWPSFFAIADAAPQAGSGPRQANGLLQQWCLTTQTASFASEPLVIEEASLTISQATGNATCNTKLEVTRALFPITVTPNVMQSIPFIFLVRKHSLEDRRPTILDTSLSITWRRASDPAARTAITVLAVPQLTLPSAEPRVLCTVAAAPRDTATEMLHLVYTLENPSMHFLTFTVTMEASDDFAYAGPKFRTLSLTPMSRVAIEYHLLVYPQADGGAKASGGEVGPAGLGGGKGRWVWPVLRVVDAYFQKTLRVLDAGVGVRSDGKGGVGVWVPDS